MKGLPKDGRTAQRILKQYLIAVDDKLVWLKDMGGSRGRLIKKGDTAGFYGNKGIMKLGLLGGVYPASHLMWLYHYGEWPLREDEEGNVLFVAYKDRDYSNIHPSNLHLQTHKQLSHKRKMNCNNVSGFNGVNQNFRNGAWRAQVGYEGKNISLIETEDFDEAVKVRTRANETYEYKYEHGEVR